MTPPSPVVAPAPRKPAVPPPTRLGQDVTAAFTVPEGTAVTVWAESPQLYNPTSIDVDAKGRVWVAEAVNYRKTIKKHGPESGYLDHPRGDRVVILEDTNLDGVADSSKVFVEDKDLVAPLGVSVIGNRVLVSSSPNVFVYTDADGDDKPDKREVFLGGFGGFDHDHGVHGFTFGPDGRLYTAVGNHGPHIVKDANGFTLRSTAEGASDTARLSDDGRIWIQGMALQVNPDGTGLRVFADNFRNSFENVVDAFGTVFQNDNDDDGNRSCRFTFVLEGGSYGYSSLDGRRSWRADARVDQTVQAAHFHTSDPGTVPPTEFTGAGAPTGIAIYDGAALPASVRGLVLNADAGRSVVYGHRVKAAGAGYLSERSDFFAPKGRDDEARRFRPSDVAVATDGSVFVADWYDPGVGGHNMGDHAGFGRIYRIVPQAAARAPKPPKVDASTEDGAIAALLSPAVNVRAVGWQALMAKPAAALPALQRRLAGAAGTERARLLWALAALDAGRPRVQTVLGDADPAMRILALRALRRNAKSPSDLLPHAQKLARDPDPAVRREVAVYLRDVPTPAALPVLVALAKSAPAGDRVYLEALGVGARGREADLYAALSKALPDTKDPLRWTPSFVEIAWRLHPPAAVPGLLARANAASLPQSERQRALVALAFVEDARAANALTTIAESGAEPYKAYAFDLAFDRANSAWKPYGVFDRLSALAKGTRSAKAATLEPLKTTLENAHAAPNDVKKAVEALAADDEGGRFLVGLAGQKKLTPKQLEWAGASIFNNPDVGVRALASQYFKRPSFDGVEFPPIGDLLAMTGDPARGNDVFFSPTAACAECHEYGGKGRSVGPSLSEIAGKMGREALFDAILNPSAGIAFGYEPWSVTTKDQQTFTGFIIGDGETVLLKDVSGEQRVIAAKDIVHRQREKMSIMPDNIALGMKPQQLVDLVAFLASGPKGPSPSAAK